MVLLLMYERTIRIDGTHYSLLPSLCKYKYKNAMPEGQQHPAKSLISSNYCPLATSPSHD